MDGLTDLLEGEGRAFVLAPRRRLLRRNVGAGQEEQQRSCREQRRESYASWDHEVLLQGGLRLDLKACPVRTRAVTAGTSYT